MDRTQAARRVEKLRAVTEARGATSNEARVAAAKVRDLESRFDLRSKSPPLRSEPRRREQRVWAAPVYGTPWTVDVPDWEFDVQTGKASENVKVKRYNSPSDWSIEIPL